MKDVRKTFIKFGLLLFAVVLGLSIWRIGSEWKTFIWIAIAVCVLFAIVPILGKPPHLLWRAFVDRTTQGMRFFCGVAVFTGLVAAYQLTYLYSGFELQWPLPLGQYRWWGLAAIIGIVVGSIRPLADLAFGFWMALAKLIQAVMSRVILTIVYVLTVLPVGLIAKLVGKRFLDKEIRPDAESYWIDRQAVPFDQKRYRRHF